VGEEKVQDGRTKVLAMEESSKRGQSARGMRTNQVIELLPYLREACHIRRGGGGTIFKMPSLEECLFTITTWLKIDITTPKALLPFVKY